MKAFALAEQGPALTERPEPRPGDDDVLVRVRAAALNRADLGMARGHRHGRAGGPGAVLGVEWAGEVVEVGTRVSGLTPGDRVMGSGAGAFAEYACSDYGRVLAIPDGLDFAEAACLPVALQTMHDALVTNGGLSAGQSVLVHGASSGVGLMGLQLARELGAGRVLGSARSESKRARLAEFGADAALDPGAPDWVERVRAKSGGDGVDLVIDQVSGPDSAGTLRATRIGGCIVNVGRLGGMRAEFDFDLHALRRIRYVGVTFRTRSREDVREITRRLRPDVEPALAAGRLRLPIDRRFPLDEADKALEHMAADRHFGKITLEI